MSTIHHAASRPKRRVLVAAISGERVVLVKRRCSEWGFPGGPVHDEDTRKAASRILHSETGFYMKPDFLKLGTSATNEDSACTLYLAPCQSNAFAKLKDIGPRGHIITTCTLRELDTIGLRTLHRDMVLKLRA